MQHVELKRSSDGITDCRLADVEDGGWKRGYDLGNVPHLDCRHNVDVLGEADFSVGDAGNGAHDQVGHTQPFESIGGVAEQISLLHGSASSAGIRAAALPVVRLARV